MVLTSSRCKSFLFLLLLGVSHGFLLPSWGASRFPVSSRLQAGIKGVEAFDGAFVLDPQVQELLEAYLQHPDMLKLVTTEAKCTSATYTGRLFQPMPYSPATRYGMPREFEEFRNNPDFAICHVPPVIMFKAKVFRPSRLCAVYQVEGVEPEERMRALARREEEMTREAARAAEEAAAADSVDGEEQLRDTPGWGSVGQALRRAWEDESGEEEIDLDAYMV